MVVNTLIESCICGCTDFTESVKHNISIRRCLSCGVDHQVVNMTPSEYLKWYEEDYLDVYTHPYPQDKLVAKTRVKRYGDYLQEPVFDFGCGNCAFVDELVENDYEAYGLDLHVEAKGPFYRNDLFGAAFPTEHFGTVTAHDVLEHVVDLYGIVKELVRITTTSGRIIVDYPDFYSSSGKKHWKPIEHIWMMRSDRLVKMFEYAGCHLVEKWEPVPGKFTFVFKKKLFKRKRILVPPGMGDSFWCMTKIQSLMEREGIGVPEIQIASNRPDRNRSLEFLQKFPFGHCTGYYQALGNANSNPIWREAYFENSDGVFEDVLGYDWFLSANGAFRFDKSLDEIMPKWKTNWYPPMFVSTEERDIQNEFAKAGPYIVVFITSAGPYSRWIKEYPVASIASDLKDLHAQGLRVVLTGAHWDCEDPAYVILRDLVSEFAEDLIGRTTMDEFLAVLRGCTGTYGFCGGNTIFSTVLKKPTIILWNDYYNTKFHTASCPPDSLNNWYKPINTRDARRINPAQMLLKLIKENKE